MSEPVTDLFRARRFAPIALLGAAGAVVILAGVWALRLAMQTPAGAVAAAPTNLSADDAGSLATEQAAIQSARAYLSQDKPGSAEAIARAALERWPDRQSLNLLLGETLLHMGRKPEAYEYYDRAIIIGPDHPEYRFAAGTIAAEIGRLDDAELHYLAAQKYDPKNPKYPLYLSQVQRKRGATDEARASLVLATKLDPNLGVGWAALAALALDENRPQVALSYIERARRLEPSRLDWRVIEARALLRESRPEDAATLLLAASDDERLRSLAALRELASALGMLSKPADAAEQYIRALAVDTTCAECAFEAAQWLERAGDRNRAGAYAAHAAAMGHKEAAALLERLGR